MRLQTWLVLVLAVVLAAGCGDTESSGGGGGGEAAADPAQAVPADSPVYVEAVVKPSGDQGENASALLERFLGEKSLTEILDGELDEDPETTYSEDIEPWLGDRIGIGVTELQADEPSFVAAAALADADAAAAFVKESAEPAGSHSDVDIFQDDDTFVAITGDYLVLSQDKADLERGIDSAGAESLGDAQQFSDAMGDLPEERLGALYVDTKVIGELALADPTLEPQARPLIEKFFGDGMPITAALTAQEDSATIESRLAASALSAFGPLATTEAPELVAEAPAGTIAVIGYTDVGETLKATVETFAGALGGAAMTAQLESQTGLNLDRDVFSWIGDLAVFVRGDSLSSLDGAIVIEEADEDAAEAAVPKIIAAARQSGAPVQPAQIDGADEAFSVPIPGAPGPLVMAEGDGRVVFAIGEEAARQGLSPTETIEDSGLYDRAQESLDGVAPATIIDFAAALRLAEAAGATSDEDYAEAKPYLEQFDLLAAGAEKDGDEYRSLFTVKVK